jgi:hypothetical protein
MRKEHACKIRIHALIAANELVGKGESRHMSMLLEPEG